MRPNIIRYIIPRVDISSPKPQRYIDNCTEYQRENDYSSGHPNPYRFKYIRTWAAPGLHEKIYTPQKCRQNSEECGAEQKRTHVQVPYHNTGRIRNETVYRGLGIGAWPVAMRDIRAANKMRAHLLRCLRYAEAVMTPRPLIPALLAAAMLLALGACGPPEAPKEGTSAPETTPRIVHAVQEDLSRLMPTDDRVSAALVEEPLLGVEQFPGGTLAEYSKGGKTFQQFLFKAPNVAMTAVYLGHCKDAMANPKFVASFGGYFGEIGGKPVFVFVKNEYVSGLVGLPLDEADAQGRVAAARIP